MLNRMKKSRRGFTLVELIVVIAILAILAGVAIPVYSGYIKKANAAADNQLLAAVNSAFGAACLQNGVKFQSIGDGGASLIFDENNNKLIAGIGNVAGLNANQIEKLNDAFKIFFAGNLATELKYYTDGDIAFYAKKGFLGGGTLRSTTFTTSGGQQVTLTASQEVIDEINESIWTNSDDLGVENLLGSVDQVTGIVANLFNNNKVRTSLIPVLTSDEFVAYALQAIDGGEGQMAQDFQAAVQQYMGAHASVSEETAKAEVVKSLIPQLMQSPNAGQRQLVANAMVLYTAANSDVLVSSGWYDTFKNEGGVVNTEKVMTVLNGEPADANTFAELAAAYAMNMAYNAYASDTGEGAMSKIEYLNSAQGSEAFNAYMDTMSLITSNCTNADITAEVLSYGFSGDALIEALNALLGN